MVGEKTRFRCGGSRGKTATIRKVRRRQRYLIHPENIRICQSCAWSAEQRGNIFFPVPVRTGEFGLAKHVRPSPPTSASSFYTLRLNLALTHGLFSHRPLSASKASKCMPSTAIGPVPSLLSQADASRWRSLPPRVCRQGPVVLKVVRATGVANSGYPMEHFLCTPFLPHTLLVLYRIPGMWSSLLNIYNFVVVLIVGTSDRRYFQHVHFIPIVGMGKRGVYQLVHGLLCGTTLRFTGPVPADSRQWTSSVRNCVTR